MPRGRPRDADYDAERAAARRAKVREYVRAFRQRKKDAPSLAADPNSAGFSGYSSLVFISEDQENAVPRRGSSSSLDTASSKKKAERPRPSNLPWRRLMPRGDGDPPAVGLRNKDIGLHAPRWIVPNEAAEWKVSFLAFLQHRYVPNTTKFANPLLANTNMPITCVSWINAACDIAARDGGSLGHSMAAMSLSLVGAERKNSNMHKSAMVEYQRALKQLNSDLSMVLSGSNDGQSDTSGLQLACFACSIFELVNNGSFMNLVHHMSGIGLLIQHGASGSLKTSLGRDVLYEYRLIDITICLSVRKDSFLSRREWIDFPWKSTHPQATSLLHTVVDIAYGIPPIMTTFDRTQHAASEAALRSMLVSLLKIRADLEDWEIRVNTECGTNIYHFAPSQWFHACLTKVFPYTFDFCNFPTATALLFCWTFKVRLLGLADEIRRRLRKLLCVAPRGTVTSQFQQSTLNEIDTEIENDNIECIYYARLICQALEYFFASDKRLIGRFCALLPFETAFLAFRTIAGHLCDGRMYQGSDLSAELAFCEWMGDVKFKGEGLPSLNVHGHF